MFHLNPYIAGDPIRSEQKFFGREDVLRRVKNVLQNPTTNAIVLFGQRRIGKTSILLQLANRLLKEGTYTPVYFDLQDKASKPLAGLLYDLACGINEALGRSAPLPESFDEEGEYFRKEFLPSAASAISEGRLVLLFDEFDVLDSISSRQAGQAFFPYLRQWMSEMSLVRFVFVIGRRPEDLSTDTHSAFKTVRASLVSRLDRDSAEAMIRQSEKEGSLAWSDAAVERVWELCQGHAFLTQLMCSVVFERMNDLYPSEAALVEGAHVDESVGEALDQGANAFHWIWGGLPPAERVVCAAMAEIKKEAISQEELIEKLNQSGVRLIVRELELAPDMLAEWELLNGGDEGYSFTVPLFKRWVAKNRPLRRVKDELDRLDPLAEGLFQTGQNFYGIGQTGEAESQLRRSLDINPNHLKSKLLLGRILVEGGRADEATVVLEEAYQYDQSATRAELVKALLALAGDAERDEQSRVQAYERILLIDKSQPLARERLGQLLQERRARELQEWVKLADEMEQAGDWQAAIEIFRELTEEHPDSVEWRLRLGTAVVNYVSAEVARAESYEMSEEWTKAAAIYADLTKQHPDLGDWAARLHRVDEQEQVESKYRQALGALETGDRMTAVNLLVEVIHKQPYFKESARYLLLAVRGVDVQLLQQQLKKLEREAVVVEELEERIRHLEKYEKMYLGEYEGLPREVFNYLENNNLDATVICTDCGESLKARGLPRHFMQKHKESEHEK